MRYMVYLNTLTGISRMTKAPPMYLFRQSKHWVGGLMYEDYGVYREHHYLAII